VEDQASSILYPFMKTTSGRG